MAAREGPSESIGRREEVFGDPFENDSEPHHPGSSAAGFSGSPRTPGLPAPGRPTDARGPFHAQTNARRAGAAAITKSCSAEVQG